MRKTLCAWLALSAGLCLPAIAHAEDEPKPYPECTKTPTDAETAAAKGAYQAGNASFDEADYPRAINYWEDAYRRDCTANLLLKNLARAYELYGQKRQAVVALETFLVREPNAADRDQIQRRIEVLKKQIASEKAAPPTTTTPAANTTTPAPTEPPPTQQSPAPLAADHAHGGRPVLALVVTGVGGVVLIVGVAVYAKAAKDTKNFEDQCPNRVCDTSKMGYQALIDGGNDARSREITGGVVTGIGAATVAGGLLWYFLAPHGGGTSATASAGTLSHPLVTPAVSPGFSGVSLSGAF